MRRLLSAFLSLFGLFGAVSCIDYREDFTIKADGSGSIHSVISMKKALADDPPEKLRDDLETMFAQAEGLSLAAYDVEIGEERRTTEFTIAFDQVSRLKEALAGADGGVLTYFGTFEAEEQEDRYLMRRTIDMSGEVKEGFGKRIKVALMEDSHLTYRMRFPTEVITANGEIDPADNSVAWTYTVSEALQGPLVMTAEIRKPPLMQWLFMGAGGLLACVVLVIGIVRLKRRRGASATGGA